MGMEIRILYVLQRVLIQDSESGGNSNAVVQSSLSVGVQNET